MRCLEAIVVALMIAVAGAGQNAKPAGAQAVPLTIEIFSDFACSHCKHLHEEVIPLLKRDYVSTGKARIVYRQFPLPANVHSREAASYAVAAEKIGKFEAVAGVLFSRQLSWSSDGKVDQVACSVLTPAEARKVRSLVKDPSVAARIDEDVLAGYEIPLRQTPTMVLTRAGKSQVITTQNYDLLRLLLNDFLR
jgi:protein-disulfide isomerase